MAQTPPQPIIRNYSVQISRDMTMYYSGLVAFLSRFCFSVVHSVLLVSHHIRVNAVNCPLSRLAQGYLSLSVTSINYE